MLLHANILISYVCDLLYGETFRSIYVIQVFLHFRMYKGSYSKRHAACGFMH